jgi:hypothetical protein
MSKKHTTSPRNGIYKDNSMCLFHNMKPLAPTTVWDYGDVSPGNTSISNFPRPEPWRLHSEIIWK